MNTIRAKLFNSKNKIVGYESFSPLNKFMTKYNYSTIDKNNEIVKEKKPNGLQIECEIKSPLKEFLNTNTASRVFVLKYAWKYIKDNNLQNPDMKRKIIPDKKLKQVLEKDEVDMLEIPKLLFKHVISYRKE
ncbi:SWIB/MDM2 domain-containing protein, putative [Plasmodium berghei]|uniref:SWIB/MDM2 domain-containing protein, putative n=2 Tax=Plasmodium berghei TaxID=5821 RepID=A0A509AUW1_PLABA|nr:SWIB/MDM2 domain-containing protein, putative [Plasmodium berghei ANKA]CXI80898.1 SWIB/MDM2 domain-containing protein, putative [Plasmodium berghei]SCM25461.1 SWIB/MDM2 domain-containing protein, putative [Plasmodium berghei]SCN27374.1 SWIB/MDM2 domain-containing protein, putative [Plasmodium berghei]SCO62032.1 SWIB/MDM2 domain-containing protein, putative [Plasmodium berghei]SCO63800.1 SWIB/MDM2 domain-containing protein, putative [Plasmodium berghei]|eukprot:XP_034423007.1 SWIB/MDM2 domain-containing protein, putative [Plasmodium berghei ANKA]